MVEPVPAQYAESVATPSTAPQLEYAGFWIRFAARLVDLVVTYVVAFVTPLAVIILAVPLARVAGFSLSPLLAAMQHPSWVSFIAALLAGVAYETVSEGVHGSTVGKMVLGLAVLDERGDFCSLRQALGRSFAYFIDGLVLGAPAYHSIRGSARRQRLGDRWARTVVVRRRSLAPAQRRPVALFAVAAAAACLAHAVLLAMGWLFPA